MAEQAGTERDGDMSEPSRVCPICKAPLMKHNDIVEDSRGIYRREWTCPNINCNFLCLSETFWQKELNP